MRSMYTTVKSKRKRLVTIALDVDMRPANLAKSMLPAVKKRKSHVAYRAAKMHESRKNVSVHVWIRSRYTCRPARTNQVAADANGRTRSRSWMSIDSRRPQQDRKAVG